MDREILEKILKMAEENSTVKLSNEKIMDMVSETEKKLGRELTGYGKHDKPYNQFYSDETLNDSFNYERIGSFVVSRCIELGDKIAYKCGKNVTFKDLADNILKCAKALKNLGVKENDVVVIQSLATPEAIEMFFAVNLIGATVRPIDPMSNIEAIKKVLTESKAKTFVTISPKYFELRDLSNDTLLDRIIYLPITNNLSFVKTKEKGKVKLVEKLSELFIRMANKDNLIMWDTLISPYSRECISLNDVQVPFKNNQCAAIFPTSGSTGEPRGVSLTNENLLASVFKQQKSGLSITGEDTLFNPMPTHSSYFWDDVLLAMVYGVTTTLSPLFDAETSTEQIIKASCSIVLSGPVLIEKMCDYVEANSVDDVKESLGKIRHFVSGGDILPLELERKGNQLLKQVGSSSVIENALGMSELSGPAMIPNGMMENKVTYREGSVGLVLPGNEVAIFKYNEEESNRDILEEGYNDGLLYYEIGEICFSCDNPTLFSEYYNNEKATEESKIRHTDGTFWYHTGDLGYMEPEGHMFCTGRKSGLIVRSGHKVWAKKIENVINEIDGISDCAVIGVPDQNDKEVPACFVSFEEQCPIELRERLKGVIQSSVMQNIDSSHVPKYIDVLDEIPRNLMLKVKVGELKKIFDAQHSSSLQEKHVYVKDKTASTTPVENK